MPADYCLWQGHSGRIHLWRQSHADVASRSGEGTLDIGWWIKVTGLPIFYWNYMLKGYEWFFKHDTAFKGDAA